MADLFAIRDAWVAAGRDPEELRTRLLKTPEADRPQILENLTKLFKLDAEKAPQQQGTYVPDTETPAFNPGVMDKIGQFLVNTTGAAPSPEGMLSPEEGRARLAGKPMPDVSPPQLSAADALSVPAGFIAGKGDMNLGTAVMGRAAAVAQGTGAAAGAALRKGEGPSPLTAFLQEYHNRMDTIKEGDQEIKDNPYARVGYWLGATTEMFSPNNVWNKMFGKIAGLGTREKVIGSSVDEAGKIVKEVLDPGTGIAKRTIMNAVAGAGTGFAAATTGTGGEDLSLSRGLKGAVWGGGLAAGMTGIAEPATNLIAVFGKNGAAFMRELASKRYSAGQAAYRSFERLQGGLTKWAYEAGWVPRDMREVLDKYSLKDLNTVSERGGPAGVIGAAQERLKGAMKESFTTLKERYVNLSSGLSDALQMDITTASEKLNTLLRDNLKGTVPRARKLVDGLFTSFNDEIAASQEMLRQHKYAFEADMTKQGIREVQFPNAAIIEAAKLPIYKPAFRGAGLEVNNAAVQGDMEIYQAATDMLPFINKALGNPEGVTPIKVIERIGEDSKGPAFDFLTNFGKVTHGLELHGDSAKRATGAYDQIRTAITSLDQSGTIDKALRTWHSSFVAFKDFTAPINKWRASLPDKGKNVGRSASREDAVDAMLTALGKVRKRGEVFGGKTFSSINQVTNGAYRTQISSTLHAVKRMIPVDRIESVSNAVMGRVIKRLETGTPLSKSDAIQLMQDLNIYNVTARNLIPNIERSLGMPKGTLEDIVRPKDQGGNPGAFDFLIKLAKKRGDKNVAKELRGVQAQYKAARKVFPNVDNPQIKAFLAQTPDQATHDSLAIMFDIIERISKKRTGKTAAFEQFVQEINAAKAVSKIKGHGEQPVQAPGSGAAIVGAASAANLPANLGRFGLLGGFPLANSFTSPVYVGNALYKAGILKNIKEANVMGIQITKLYEALVRAHTTSQAQKPGGIQDLVP
jgi:hypothetical protein